MCLSSLKTRYDNPQSVIKFNSQHSLSGYKGGTNPCVRSHQNTAGYLSDNPTASQYKAICGINITEL
jgi:hypothetical protein